MLMKLERENPSLGIGPPDGYRANGETTWTMVCPAVS